MNMETLGNDPYLDKSGKPKIVRGFSFILVQIRESNVVRPHNIIIESCVVFS